MFNIDLPEDELIEYYPLQGSSGDIEHIGTKYHSGRYPYGSGENPFQHDPHFLVNIRDLRSTGMTNDQLAEHFGFSSTEEFEYAWRSIEYEKIMDMSSKMVKKKIGVGDDGHAIYETDANGNPVYVNKYSEEDIARALGYNKTDYKGVELDEGSSYRLRIAKGVDKDYIRSINRAFAVKYYNSINPATGKKYTLDEVAEVMGLPGDSAVRNLLNEARAAKMEASQEKAREIEKLIDEQGMTRLTKSSAAELGISETELRKMQTILENDGYPIYKRRFEQVTTPNGQTTGFVVCPPGTEYKDIYKNEDDIKFLVDYLKFDNDGNVRSTNVPPKSLDSSRLMIKYADEVDEHGVKGIDKDGIIEIRRGVQDLYLGDGKNYSQVRILVDGDRYLKGMAVYADDLPDGVDVRFNSNKPSGTPMGDVLKKTKDDDPTNPFGSALKTIEKGGQMYYTDENGEQQLSLINKRADEGDWGEWSKKLPAQFLAKQPEKLIKSQLNLAISQRKEELDAIENISIPTIKKYFLNKFAQSCDTSAVDLEAASLPRQQYQVILPISKYDPEKNPDGLRDDEIYAPNYTPGEKVALIRFPHEGTFEIPILTVNNNNPEGKRVITPGARDAVGITPASARKLSGADFDGDTVMVIPLSDKVNVSSQESLYDPADKNPDPTQRRTLVDFDTDEYEYSKREVRVGSIDNQVKKLKRDAKKKGITLSNDEIVDKVNEFIKKEKIDGGSIASYDDLKKELKEARGIKIMTKQDTQKQMGMITNLIMDMSLQAASPDELARATKHAMVVIDANKHGLDYKASEIENGIKELKQKYQKKEDGGYGGAATLLTRAGSQDSTTKTRGSGRINPETGELEYKPATYIDWKTGEETVGTQKTTKMAKTKDAFTLVSDMQNPVEVAYAQYANTLKALANEARKEILATPTLEFHKEASKIYANEVASIKAQLDLAMLNKGREDQAQQIAKVQIKMMEADNPGMTKEEKKKFRQRALTKARAQTGSKRNPVKITDKEWEAIQAGAIHDTTLKRVLEYADVDTLRDRATPKKYKYEFNTAKINNIRQMLDLGYTWDDLARRYGVSTSTLQRAVKADDEKKGR